MVWLGQAVKGEHSEYSGQSCSQDSEVKSNRNKCWPGMIRLATDIDRIVHDRHPVFQRISATHAQDGANERNQRHAIVVSAHGFRCLFQRIGSIGVHFAIAGIKCSLGRVDEVSRILKLCHQSVNWRCVQVRGHSFTFACGSIVRISNMEIAGMKRMNRKKSKVKKPIVPSKVITSHLVNQYIPQALGRKSRWRLVMMIT